MTLPLPAFSRTLPMTSGLLKVVVVDAPGFCPMIEEDVTAAMVDVVVEAATEVDVLDVVVVCIVVVVAHAMHGPPQSIPFSPWFCIPSEQEGHAAHGPPQSIPVSFWFFIPS